MTRETMIMFFAWLFGLLLRAHWFASLRRRTEKLEAKVFPPAPVVYVQPPARSGQISELQAKLGLVETGIYDDVTRGAVASWQEAHPLVKDIDTPLGECDPDTLACILQGEEFTKILENVKREDLTPTGRVSAMAPCPKCGKICRGFAEGPRHPAHGKIWISCECGTLGHVDPSPKGASSLDVDMVGYELRRAK